VLLTPTSHAALNPEMSGPWFECCSQRIDQMKAVEDVLAEHLLSLCQTKTSQAEQELARLLPLSDATTPGDFFDEPTPAPELQPKQPLESQLGRSVLALMQAQAQRLAAVSAELDQARSALNERKVIERAKGLQMAQHQLTENDAHKTLRQMAMNQGKRLLDVANTLCAMGNNRPHPQKA